MTEFDRALVRAVPRRYAPAYVSKGIHIDARLADMQHAVYARALEQSGVIVQVTAADEDFYDCVFVEDTAVVWRDHALITRMASHREGEQRGVVEALKASHTLMSLSADARLEGGDVLHTEDTTYVGLSRRTNARGADQLAEFLSAFGRRVVPIPISTALHLKTVATYLGNGTILVAPGQIDLRRFQVDAIIETASGEAAAANCVRVRDSLLVRSGYAATLERIGAFATRHALTVRPLDLSEFEKGDGSATCLSLLWQAQTVSNALPSL